MNKFFSTALLWIKRNYKWLLLLLLVIFYFSYPMQVFWDSGHYLQYVKILENRVPFQTWDIVRGPSFPVLIHLSNMLFGKTAMGILIFSLIFYLIMLFFSKKILEIASSEEKKTRNILLILFFLLVVVNPIIYGYYHSLLTEFVAMTVSIMSCYFAWKLYESVENKQKTKFILSCMYFVIMPPLTWFLKQIYVSTALFPLVGVILLALINFRDWKKKIKTLAVAFLSVLSLGASIMLWNGLLEYKGINLNTQSSSSNLFGFQLVWSLNRFKMEGDMMNVTSNKVEVLDDEDKIVGEMNLDIDEDGIATSSAAVKFLGEAITKHPEKVLKSYFNNYLVISDVYAFVKEGDSSERIRILPDFNILGCMQNCIIAAGITEEKSNIWFMPPKSYEEVVDYEQKIGSPVFLKSIFSITEKPNVFITNCLMISLPFIWITLFVFLIIRRQKEQKSQGMRKLYLAFILLTYAFLHVVAHVIMGGLLDRYASPTYIVVILAYMLLVVGIINLFKESNITPANILERFKLWQKMRKPTLAK